MRCLRLLEVMIVDDMEIMREQLKGLEIWGAKTGFVVSVEAKDGQDAIKKLREKKVDLVITDIRMPVVDGVELLKKIISEELSYCVVFLSEYTEFEYARQGLVYGAFDYIIKPVSQDKIEGVLVKVKKYIEKKKMEKEKIKNLETEFQEKVEFFYEPEDLMKIIKSFKEMDIKVIKVASELIDKIEASVDYDLLKISYILNKITLELIGQLKEIYPWLSKFVNLDEYTEINFSTSSSLQKNKEIFLKMIEELIMKIKYFCPCNEKNSMLRNICKCILVNVEKQISIKSIADQIFLNQSYLSTLFKEKTGTSLLEYITMVKMERAKVLFHDSQIKNYEVAYKLGYKDVEYFSRVFKKYVGINPSEFKAGCITKIN
jgi:two-component system, response regulator YesN